MMRRFLVIGSLFLAAAFAVSPGPSSAAQSPRAFVKGICKEGLQAASANLARPQRIVAFQQLLA